MDESKHAVVVFTHKVFSTICITVIANLMLRLLTSDAFLYSMHARPTDPTGIADHERRKKKTVFWGSVYIFVITGCIMYFL